MRSNSRKNNRVPRKQQASVLLPPSEEYPAGQTADAMIADASPDGVRIRHDFPLAKGELLVLTIRMGAMTIASEQQRSFKTQARVEWSKVGGQGSRESGLHFTFTSARDRETWKTWLEKWRPTMF